MGFPVPKVQRELITAGSHIANCVQLIDLGSHESTYDGKTSVNRKLRLTFEIPAIRRQGTGDDGEPYDHPALIGRVVNQNIGSKAALGRVLRSWGLIDSIADGLGVVVGMPAVITIVHVERDENVYDNIDTITSLPDGVNAPPIETELVLYHLSEFDQDLHDSLPGWIRERIEESPEFAKVAEARSAQREELDSTLEAHGL